MDGRLTARLGATLGLVVTLDLLLAIGFALLLEPWVAAGFVLIGIESTIGVIGVLTVSLVAVLLVVQLRYTRRELLAEAGALDGAPDAALTDRITRLAAQLDAPVPTVRVVDSPVANSMAVGDLGAGTIVVSRGLLETLDGPELDAVLAHELVHLKNRDAVVMTVASFVPALVADEYSPFDGLPKWVKPTTAFLAVLASVILAGTFLDAPIVTATGLVQFLTAVTVTFVVGGIVLGVLAAAILAAASSLSRYREFVADRDGARLTGSPIAMANALETLASDYRVPMTDKRRISGGLCLLPHGFRIDEGDESDTFGVDIDSHPPLDARIDRLLKLAGRLEV